MAPLSPIVLASQHANPFAICRRLHKSDANECLRMGKRRAPSSSSSSSEDSSVAVLTGFCAAGAAGLGAGAAGLGTGAVFGGGASSSDSSAQTDALHRCVRVHPRLEGAPISRHKPQTASYAAVGRGDDAGTALRHASGLAFGFLLLFRLFLVRLFLIGTRTRLAIGRRLRLRWFRPAMY